LWTAAPATVPATDFEEGAALRTVANVCVCTVKEARQERAPQSIVIYGERICECQERTACSTFALSELPTDKADRFRMSITYRFRHECVGDGLARPYGGKLCAHEISQRRWLWAVARKVSTRERWRNLVIAKEASDLFRDIRFKLNVTPPRGYGCKEETPLFRVYRSCPCHLDWRCFGYVSALNANGGEQ